MEMDEITWVPAVETAARLTAMRCGRNIVDRDVVGGDEAGEMEELVEMTLCKKRHHHHRNFFGCHIYNIYIFSAFSVLF